jgi:hypothetical protein
MMHMGRIQSADIFLDVALLLVDKERSSYGLRYNDFQRYR